jgi:hypothetical protein
MTPPGRCTQAALSWLRAHLSGMHSRSGGAPRICSSTLPGGSRCYARPGNSFPISTWSCARGYGNSSGSSRQRGSIVLASGHWPPRQERTAAPRFPSLPTPAVAWRGSQLWKPGQAWHQAWALGLGPWGRVPAVLEIQVLLVSAAETSRRAARPRKRPIPELPVTGSRGSPETGSGARVKTPAAPQGG